MTEPVIRSAAAGMKQGDLTWTTVLNDLFAPMARKRTKDLGLTEDEEAKYVRRLSREVEGTGAMDRVAEGTEAISPSHLCSAEALVRMLRVLRELPPTRRELLAVSEGE